VEGGGREREAWRERRERERKSKWMMTFINEQDWVSSELSRPNKMH
jgi:hypothetical protein